MAQLKFVCDEQACDILDSSVSPESLAYHKTYPNPFNPVTTINLMLLMEEALLKSKFMIF